MMITTALVWREWSKVEVPATPTSQTRCVPHLSEVYTYLKLILVLQDFLMILTSPSVPSRTSGSPTDPSSAPPSLNPQTQLNWIRSDQLDYMNVVWPWSFLIISVVENMLFRRWSITKIWYFFEFQLLAPSGALIAILTYYWSTTTHPPPTFSDHTGPQHWTFTFWATTAI